MPQENMVVVTTASDYSAPYDLFYEYILPAIKSQESLPSNPAGISDLNQINQQLLSQGVDEKKPIPEHPPLATQITGKTYSLDPNPLELQNISLQFAAQTCTLTLGHPKSTYQYQLGLNGIYHIEKGTPFGEWPIHNQAALKGSWQDNDTFSIDFISIGRPEFLHIDCRFNQDNIELTITVYGDEPITFPIKGTAKPGAVPM